MSAPRRRDRARAGFTLIEVLAVLFLTALVLGTAITFYVDLSNESTHAAESTREVRRATTLIDRIARDIERTVLVKKPEDKDPLAHPWIFLAEPHLAENGSDRLKFMMRSEPPRTSEGPTSDLNTVAYTLEHSQDGETYELHRWSSPRLPERLDREFPPPDDPASLVLADGLSHFALRFMGATGEWVDRWDSSQLADSSELPVAVEIELAIAPQNGDREQAQNEPLSYARRVLLPMRPLDMVALLDPNQLASADGNEECELTLADCIDWSKVGGGGGAGGLPGGGMPGGGGGDEGGPMGGGPGGGGPTFGGIPAGTNAADLAALGDLIANAPNICWDQYRAVYGNHPAVREQCR